LRSGSGTSICVLLLSGGFVSRFLGAGAGAGVGAAGTTEGLCGLCAPLFEGSGIALFFEEGSGMGARDGRIGVAGVGFGEILGEARGGMLAPGFGAMLGEGGGFIDGGGIDARFCGGGTEGVGRDGGSEGVFGGGGKEPSGLTIVRSTSISCGFGLRVETGGAAVMSVGGSVFAGSGMPTSVRDIGSGVSRGMRVVPRRAVMAGPPPAPEP
jgi:hypothetical protein